MAPPRWLVDEMLGRLARYLRFVGCDAVYLRGVTDDELLARAEGEGRILLTRDVALARRAPTGFLVRSPFLRDQWRAVRGAWPEVPVDVRFERCSLCNGLLRTATAEEVQASSQAPIGRSGPQVLSCSDCGHLYWEGSHTEHIRRQIAAWERSP